MNDNVKSGEVFRLADLVPYQEGSIVNMDVVANCPNTGRRAMPSFSPWREKPRSAMREKIIRSKPVSSSASQKTACTA